MTDCGSVASGSATMNIVTKQGIPTSNRFSALIEILQEDNFASSQDDLSSYSGNSHDNCNTTSRITVSVTGEWARVPFTTSSEHCCVELLECQPSLISKTHNDDSLSKFSLKGNKNKTGFFGTGI